MKYSLYTLAVAVFFSTTVKAQYNLGIATSNWSGLNSLYLNPANIADSRHRFAIDLVGINAGLDNNLGTINTRGGLFDLVNDGTTNNVFKYGSNNKFSLLAPYAQVRLPGVMVSINSKHSVALTTGVRGMNQFNNFDRSLYGTLTDPNYQPDNNLDVTSNRFNYTAHVWSEIGLSYAAVLVDNMQHELKLGVTLRYLGGIGYLGLRGNNLDARYNGTSDSLFVSKSDMEFASNALSTRNAVLGGLDSRNIFNDFFGSKDGYGFGGDIGVVYEYTPGRDGHEEERHSSNANNRYLLRFSASVMDIGSINYGRNKNSNARVTGDGVVSGKDFSDKVSNYDEFRDYAVSHGFTADTFHRDTRVYMPTRLNLGLDLHAYKRFYVNAMFVANLANRQNFGNSFYNQLTITPRYDSRILSIGTPITYGVLSNTVKVGLGIRVTGFYIGSDDMLAFVSGNQSGANIYFGGFIPINRRGTKDHGHHYHESDTTDTNLEPDYEHGGTPDSEDEPAPSKPAKRSGEQPAPEERTSSIHQEATSTGRSRYMRMEMDMKD